MKKITLVAAAICLAACSKNSEKIDALKAELVKDYGKSKEEVDAYSYDVYDAYAKEVHSALTDKHLKLADFYMDLDALDEVEKHLKALDSLEAAMPNDKNKKYFAVHAYQLRGNDSIVNNFYYLDESNALIAVKDRNKKK